MIPKYEEDFYGWSMAMAGLLKERRMTELDYDNLIEEIESMGRSNIDQLTNRLAVLITHLLKWHYQPSLQSKSWKLTIAEQRRKIKRIIKKNPSLKNKIDEAFADAYDDAIYQAEAETGLLLSTFPKGCPYTFEQCLDDEFYPE
ncbi:Protein from unkown function DUF29 [uncultured Caudovirales phage]|uniref:Protein from unkown function DUF29 n=1 Tax=uncultured Caudovirales phage TaxID=2100421 RepID=A0A6J5SVP4_9CAUD|nr:Protein from unkown function DUF29 [uncultured Caudovirales phage]